MQLNRIVFAFTKSHCKETGPMCGQIISMMSNIGKMARLMTRRCYVIIENRLSLDSALCLGSNEAKFLETEH